MNREKCDKCGSDILMGRCSCGYWFEQIKEMPIEAQRINQVLEDFIKSGKDIQSSDHHSGVCLVLFKGDYQKCMRVVDFIQKTKR